MADSTGSLRALGEADHEGTVTLLIPRSCCSTAVPGPGCWQWEATSATYPYAKDQGPCTAPLATDRTRTLTQQCTCWLPIVLGGQDVLHTEPEMAGAH